MPFRHDRPQTPIHTTPPLPPRSPRAIPELRGGRAKLPRTPEATENLVQNPSKAEQIANNNVKTFRERY